MQLGSPAPAEEPSLQILPGTRYDVRYAMNFVASSLASLLAAGLFLAPGHSQIKGKEDFLRANMDQSVKPGVDFFQYANGGWLKRHPIPASETGWGIGNEVQLDIYAQLRKIDETTAAKTWPTGSDEQKVGDFWATAMDEAKAEEQGIKPLQPMIDKIEGLKTLQDVLDESFALAPVDVDTFFEFDVSQDEKNSDVMAVHVNQGGLGLPERDFYFNPEAGVAKIRQEYIKHLGRVLKFAGDANSDADATSVMAFETDLAKISRKMEDLRDPLKNYNKMAIEDLSSKLTPSISWSAKLAVWHLDPKTIVVGQPEFFTGLEALLAKTPIETLRSYMLFHLVSSALPYLNKEAVQLDFQFYHQILSGQKEMRPRWKRVLDSEGGPLGFVLGRVFVKKYFPPAAKKRYVDLVEAFRKAFGERIDKVTWMTPGTKETARKKLAALIKKVGYPDKWKDYSALKIGRSSYVENMMNSSRWGFDDMVSKYGKPVDRKEWGMTPQTYNAYYNSSNNEIVLPAAAFEIPGINDLTVDDAVVYGYAGASTIGHEMTHGFDDDGRQFDAKGNLKEWWTKEDAAKFKQRAQLMINEFDAYQPLPGLHINGKASLGENIADYGGLLIGLDAFKKTAQYKAGKKIGGLTPLQRYFLGYALSWMDQQRPERLRRQLLSDVHAPAKWRVNGPLSNIPDFYKAFNITPGQPMWRPANGRVHIW